MNRLQERLHGYRSTISVDDLENWAKVVHFSFQEHFRLGGDISQGSLENVQGLTSTALSIDSHCDFKAKLG